MVQIGKWIGEVLSRQSDEAFLAGIKSQVKELCISFPFYGHRLEG